MNHFDSDRPGAFDQVDVEALEGMMRDVFGEL